MRLELKGGGKQWEHVEANCQEKRQGCRQEGQVVGCIAAKQIIESRAFLAIV